MEIPIGKVEPSPFQPRLHFDVEELAQDMNQHGMHLPISVRTNPPKGRYELLDGDRRRQAAQRLGWKTIQAEVREEVSDEEAARIIYAVNTQRQDYTVEENARFFDKMRKQGMSISEMERRFGRSWTSIQTYLAILDLPKPIQKALFSGRIGVGHVHQTLEYVGMEKGTFKDPEKAARLLQHAVENELSQRKYDEYLKQQKILDRIAEEREKAAQEEAKKQAEEAKRREEERKKREAELKAAEEERRRRETERAEQERLRRQAEEARRKEEERARFLEAQRKRAEQEAKTREKAAKVYEKAPEPVKHALEQETITPEEAEEISTLRPEKQKEAIESIKRSEQLGKEAKKIAIEIAKMPEPPELTPEQVAELRTRFAEAKAEADRILNDPEVRKRGENFKNWIRLSELLAFGEPSYCPNCGGPSSNLKWTCCDLNLRKAQSLAAKKVSER